MPWSVAAAVVGGVIASEAAGDAADTQADAARDSADAQLLAARESNQLQRDIYDQTRADNAARRVAGENALNTLTSYSAPPASNSVNNWYRNALGINGDEAGKAYWQGLIDRGMPVEQVYQAFQNSVNAMGERQISPLADSARSASISPWQFSMMQGGTTFANPNLADAAEAYANTNIGDAASAYRSTDFKDAASAYANPNLANMQKDFSTKDFEVDPGYQYRLEQGNRGVENSAAARGSQLSGATLKALARFNQNEASNEYGNAFNRYVTQRTNQYQQASGDYGRTDAQRADQYNQRANEYTLADAQRKDQYGQRIDQFNRDETQRVDKYGQRVDDYGRTDAQRANKYAIAMNQDNTNYNRLAAIADIGQTANNANQLAGQNYANQTGANTMSAAQRAGQATMSAADARASGTIGQANALASGANNAYGLYRSYSAQQDANRAQGYTDFANNYTPENYG